MDFVENVSLINCKFCGYTSFEENFRYTKYNID